MASGLPPVHLGLILDGNRRWAKEKGMTVYEGHKKGYENLKTIARAAFDRGIQYISAFVFSTENWKRSKKEVDYLLKLLLWVAKNETKILDKENIRVLFIGSKRNISSRVCKAINEAEERTKNNTKGTLLLCFNYGGQQEIADACTNLINEKPYIKEITPKEIEQNLYSPDVPAVDFVIRTSGEQRISNFMLWRLAYSEIMFVKTYWPEFSVEDLDDAMMEYAGRHRRYGA